MFKYRIFVALLLLIFLGKASAQSESPNLEFIENKGQWDSRVILKAEIGNGSLFLDKKGLKVVLHNPEDLARFSGSHTYPLSFDSSGVKETAAQRNLSGRPRTLRSHAYAVNFLQMNDAAEIIADKPLDSYNNYFIGNDSSKWARNCRIYQGVTYKNIYPGIDLRYYTSNGMLKYDIIVHPGADPRRIALQYEGVDGLTLKNNRLTVKTSVGDVKEMEPYSYQSGDRGREEISVKYRVSNDRTVRFDIKHYNNSRILVIDPTLIFSTFSGSRETNWGFTATPGPDGTFFAGGIVFGDGFPVSPGAFEGSFQGGKYDVGIIKLSSNGRNRLYATYIGGNQEECPHSMISDAQGNLVVMGRTYSTDFPFQNTFGTPGGCEMFVVKLNASGNNIIGSARIGGSKYDCVNVKDQLNGEAPEEAMSLIRNYGDDSRSEVILDASNNIYIAASTRSDKDFPITPGVFQPTFGGGDQDGVIVKLSPDCKNLIFASYLGGSQTDACFVLKINPANGDLYVAGATSSNADFPGTKTGSIQPTYSGGICDAYISIISSDGSTLRKTTYLGTNGFDAIYGLEFDKHGFPYVMGSTTGAWATTANVGFINVGAKQFVAKLMPDLSQYVYSTTFGKASPNPNISPVAFLVDRCENVYVSGWGGWLFASKDPYGLSGTSGMPVSPSAIKKTTDGRDFYFIVIQKNASALLYATYFGQNDGPQSVSEHVDGGTSRYDQNGIIYQAICANCGARSLTPFPTTPGVWSPRNGTGGEGCNMAAVKIAFSFAGVSADPRSLINGHYDSSGCVPLDVLFVDTLHNAKQYIWNFGDGTPDSSTTAYQLNHTYNATGTFRVRLIAIDSNSCNVSDTAYLNIRVRTDKAILDFNITKLPPCESLNFQFDNTSTAPPGKPFMPDGFTWDFGDGTRISGANSVTHAYAAAGTYPVRLILLDTSYCNYPDSLTKDLRVSPLVKAQFEIPDGCAPYNAFFNNTSLAGQQFFWNFGDGTTSTDVNPTHLYADTGSYTVSLLVIDPGTCNIRDSTTRTVQVHSKPIASFSTQPIPPEYNVPTVFVNSSIGATHYTYYFGDGDSTDKFSADTVKHQYPETGSYNACLFAYNPFGCTDTVCHNVDVLINSLLDVPNAFTPGRFGQNSIIMVRGFGIESMDWKIYNRWGQVVFQSNTPYYGWDGTWKGVPQPMDVYTYTLEATFSDGRKTTRRGDITLIR
ncbi:MAG: PKD domain-containing protein [Bacteroidota bacterium]|nr:PKD domain-containing protein [Bacteroidota bacterium]MDP4211006.1 PKD domain-containing protein [Bacteroidota bacterium]MDP4248772.1 PKD domain-containing protein [Bacteroidota bacterium]